MKGNETRLTEGLDETQRRKLGDLSGLVRLLESYTLPDPDMEQRARLLAALDAYLPGSDAIQAGGMKNWLHLARSQLVLFESSFWMAGLLVLLLGLALAVLDGREVLPLTIMVLSPLLAAASVVYAFRPETRILSELELLSATHPVELLFTRLAMVLSFNLLIASLLMLLVQLEGARIVLWRLVLAWMGPLLVLAGLALYATLRWGAGIGIVLPLGLWGSLVLLGWREALLRTVENTPPTAWLLMMIGSSQAVLIASALLCVVGLMLLFLARQTVTGEKYSWK